MLRGLAACAVVVLHGHDYVSLEGPARYGGAGVDLFFVTSGFIMATVATGKTPGRFLFDRAWRILPLWYLAALPWLLSEDGGSAVVWSTLTLWMVQDGAIVMPALGLGWTLSFELIFYAAFAVWLAARSRIALGVIGLCYVLCLALAFTTQRPLFVILGNPMVLEFIAGMLIAKLPRASMGWPFILGGLAWLALSPDTLGTGVFVPDLALSRAAHWGVAAALIVYGALAEERRFAARAWAPALVLGSASYSIYLFHMLAVPNFAWPFNVVLGIAVGVAFHFSAERWFQVRRADAFNLLQRVTDGTMKLWRARPRRPEPGTR